MRRRHRPRPSPALPWAAALLALAALALLGRAGREDPEAFVPPAEPERRAAIGPTEDLAPVLRRAFDPADAFAPIPAPGPLDWLSHFPEKGQTVADFVAAGPERPDEERRALAFQPLGAFDAETAPSMEALGRFASSFFQVPVAARPTIAVEALGARERVNRATGRRQLLTGDILRALKTLLPDDAFCILGVTMEDLYPDERWNFVFGQASLADRVGVYSFARYVPSFSGEEARSDVLRLVLRRSCKVLAHEAGHMFGLWHCIHFCCLMNGSNHLAESDARPLHLCPVCLRKLHLAVGFDVVDRYARLLDFAREVGFEDEATWLARRISWVEDEAADTTGPASSGAR